jgi:hypothetical protein
VPSIKRDSCWGSSDRLELAVNIFSRREISFIDIIAT